MEQKIDKTNFLIISLVYIGVFWSWLQYSVFALFSYWDELLAVLSILFIILNVDWCEIRKPNKNSIIPYHIAFIVVGLISNFLWKLTDLKTAFIDAFINLKFILVLYGIACIFKKYDLKKYTMTIKTHVQIISLLFFVLLVIDKIFHIYPVYERRFGIDSEQLFFAHPTFAAAAYCFLIAIYIFSLSDKVDWKDKSVILLLVILTCLTQRYKAIGAMILLIMLYFLTKYKGLGKIKYVYIGLGVLAIFLIARKNIYFYFFSPNAILYPRGAMLNTAFKIGKDYFPLGTGFGTFGSYLSGTNYSKVYSLYGIDQVYGMTIDNIQAISDNYWPMILGQTGFLGLILQIIVWKNLFKRFNNFKRVPLYYLSSMFSLLFLLVSSTSESATVNPIGVAMAIALGLILSQENIGMENNG